MEFCQEESAKILDQFIGNANLQVAICVCGNLGVGQGAEIFIFTNMQF